MWQDNHIRFDATFIDMQVRNGEFVIDKLDMIEDVKGNAGDQGQLMISNLRILWHSSTLPRINLSIGYNTIINMAAKNISMLKGNVAQVLHILTVYKCYRYEFIFNNLNSRSTRHYTSVIGVYRAYVSTKIYREIKLRGGFVHNKKLHILPLESISSTTPGVWNLSAEQGNVGTLIITNIRVVWFADMNCQFNVSLPYRATTNVHIKSSKFGPTLVITCTQPDGGYVLGFRVDPVHKLHILHKEISMLKASYTKTPNYGVEYVFEWQGVPERDSEKDEAKEVENVGGEISNVFGLYFNEAATTQRKPSFCSYLGLATEAPKEGSSFQGLWELLPSS